MQVFSRRLFFAFYAASALSSAQSATSTPGTTVTTTPATTITSTPANTGTTTPGQKFAGSFTFTDSASFQSMTSTQKSYLDEAAISALAQYLGVAASGVTASAHSNMGTGSLWGIQWTVIAPSATASAVNAKLNEIKADSTQFQATVTDKLAAEITAAGGTFSNSLEINNFVTSTVPVTVRLYTLESDLDEQAPSVKHAATPSFSWMAPVLGVTGLFSLIAFVAFRWNRRIAREIRLVAACDEESLRPAAAVEE